MTSIKMFETSLSAWLSDVALSRNEFERVSVFAQDLKLNISKVLLGASEAIDVAAVAVLSAQHLLLQDVPGVGKTVLAKAIARSLNCDYKRIQGQPDLLPQDIVGVSIFQPESKKWEFRPGPIFSNIVLCDELNRTPPRTQAALLESMEEKQVTVDGVTYELPKPHLVLATQNPVSQRGTFDLVESQTDRFGLSCTIGYPGIEGEISLALTEGTEKSLDNLKEIGGIRLWQGATEVCSKVHVSEIVAQYVVKIARRTRDLPEVILGASPRAAISLIRGAKALALLRSRFFVTPEDVRDIAINVLSHRLVTEVLDGAELAVREALESVEAPD